MIRLEFDRGTLRVDGAPPEGLELPGCRFDPRIGGLRAPALSYRELVTTLLAEEVPFEDLARAFGELELLSRSERRPRPYQRAALDRWWQEGGRGVVVLPTGAGKTFVAQLAMSRTKRPTLVVAPTLDLVDQWHGVLSTAFEAEIGIVGGGVSQLRPVTVTTYDSAYLQMERWGNRFGLLVFDECHHLPGPSYAIAAEASIAPFRLGLTATLERQDGAHLRLAELIGPVVYREEIGELTGEYLADYEVETLRVRLSDEERAAYEEARAAFRSFLARHRLQLGGPRAWARFLMLSARSEEGRRAFLGYRAQKRIAQASEAKLRLLGRLLERHRSDRVLVFTAENETVHEISRRFLVPPITHETGLEERREILRCFQDGTYPVVVTSRVLNEGVDVPEARVGVVLSGSGSVREHVQRLGRLLRPGEGKQAILYEVVSAGTAEERTNARRRQHHAYR